jgi:hypothetical protein
MSASPREFADLRSEPGIELFLRSAIGSLYTVSDENGWPVRMIRHFDAELEPALVGTYAEVTAAVDEWLAARPALAQLARVEQPVELGRDFVARPYHVYETSTRTYTDQAEPPPELEQLHDALRAELGAPDDDREAIVQDVVSRSLLEPSGRVFFDDDMRQFVVVEPKIALEHARRWAALPARS